MKKVGIVRKIDNLGRISIPIEIRRHMGVESGDSIDISYRDGNVILSKYKTVDEQEVLLNLQKAVMEGEKEKALQLIKEYSLIK